MMMMMIILIIIIIMETLLLFSLTIANLTIKGNLQLAT